MQTNFSKGEWVLNKDSEENFDLLAVRFKQGQKFTGRIAKIYGNDLEGIANAKLFLAAPLLLKACRLAQTICQERLLALHELHESEDHENDCQQHCEKSCDLMLQIKHFELCLKDFENVASAAEQGEKWEL